MTDKPKRIPKNRPPRTAWKPGVCPNPGGRPKTVTWVRDLARKQTIPAINALTRALKDKDGRVVVAAANSLLNRAWGTPIQSVEMTGKDGSELFPLAALREIVAAADQE